MKAIFRLPFNEKFILIHHHEAAKNVASFFPFTNGKTIHLQAENQIGRASCRERV